MFGLRLAEYPSCTWAGRRTWPFVVTSTVLDYERVYVECSYMQLPDPSPLLNEAAELVAAWGPELLSGLIGGLIVFGLTTWRDWRKARKLVARERNGLLRLVDIEVYQNIDKLDMISTSPDIGEQYRGYSELHTAHWDESRSRLAQLLPTDYIGVLVRYYGLIERIGVHLGDEGKKPSRKVARDRNVIAKTAVRDAKRGTLLSVLARETLKYGAEVRQRAAAYIEETPDYFELYENQEQEADLPQEEKAN